MKLKLDSCPLGLFGERKSEDFAGVIDGRLVACCCFGVLLEGAAVVQTADEDGWGSVGFCKCKFCVGDPLGLGVRVWAVFILENFASITPISAMAGAPLPPFEKVRCVGGFVGLAVSSVSSGGACPLPKGACWGDITA